MKILTVDIVTKSNVMDKYEITSNGFNLIESELESVLMKNRIYYTVESVEIVYKKFKFDKFKYPTKIQKDLNITMDEIVKLTKKNKLKTMKMGNTTLYDKSNIKKLVSKPMKIVKHNKNIDYNKLRISNSQSFYWWLNEY